MAVDIKKEISYTGNRLFTQVPIVCSDQKMYAFTLFYSFVIARKIWSAVASYWSIVESTS